MLSHDIMMEHHESMWEHMEVYMYQEGIPFRGSKGGLLPIRPLISKWSQDYDRVQGFKIAKGYR